MNRDDLQKGQDIVNDIDALERSLSDADSMLEMFDAHKEDADFKPMMTFQVFGTKLNINCQSKEAMDIFTKTVKQYKSIVEKKIGKLENELKKL